ncbi:MAG: acyltransferase family protein [Flavobacteriaceae bacterium]
MTKLTTRLISLDVLRGLTICFMIIVNNPGSWAHIYPPLRHAAWDGYTPTDLVFPFFMFIVGSALGIGLKKFKALSRKQAWMKVLRRSIIIFGLGFLLNAFPYFKMDTVRIMGVLQRIALSYLLASVILIYLNPKYLIPAILFVLFSYWGILYLSPGVFPMSLEENLVRILDLKLLGEQHLYGGFGIPFDPEGLLSSWPGVASIFLGVYISLGVKSKEHIKTKLYYLLISGGLLMVLAYLWNLVLPFNKPLWSSSYVLVTTAWASLVWALLIFLIDYKGWKSWAKPFVHYGRNPLFLYVLSGFYVETIIMLVRVKNHNNELVSFYNYMYTDWFVPVLGHLNGSFAFALFQAFLFWLIAYFLFKRNIIIKV